MISFNFQVCLLQTVHLFSNENEKLWGKCVSTPSDLRMCVLQCWL